MSIFTKEKQKTGGFYNNYLGGAWALLWAGVGSPFFTGDLHFIIGGEKQKQLYSYKTEGASLCI